jgi:crotonobetainyl-CoA:carnitine CoA-transferase CaiB-like acyl-CoA transferase
MPLSSFTVAEIGDDVAVRYCGRQFAQLGARVVRRPAIGDEGRGYARDDGAAYGRWLDAKKTLIKRVETDAFDLIIAGLDAGSIAEAEALRARIPNAPMLLALTWFDTEGPYAAWRGSDEIINALNGVAYNFGEAGGAPMLPQGHAPQVTAGLVGFNAAVAVLTLPRPRRPARIAVNVYDAAMCFVETGAVSAKANALPLTPRLGVNRFAPTYPCSSYPSCDGWVGVTCLTPAQWTAMCGLIARPELATDPRYATAYDRLLHADEVDELLRPAIASRATEEWVQLGDTNRIPITAMPTPAELPKMEHWRSRGAFASQDGVQAPTLPYRHRFTGEPVARWSGEGGPLAGLRVIDFSMGWAGPLCARWLGDLGADVVKIESDGHPDWWRGWEKGAVDVATREANLNFITVNRNKRGIDLDLTRSEGIAAARALIAGADVVVENFAAGVLDKLGLGPAVQRSLNPHIVSLSMPAFGNGGPRSAQRAYGSTVEQSSGLPFVNGETHWVPSLQHIAFGDPLAGIYAASAVLAALAGRERLGGAEIDLAQVACLFQMGADAIIAAQRNGGTLERTGHRRARLKLCAVVAAADGCLAVTAGEDIATLRSFVGGDSADAVAHWARERTAAEAAGQLQAAGICAAPVLPAHGLCDNAQLKASGFWTELDRAFVGRHPAPQAPFRYDGQYPPLRCAAPLLGEHSDAVLGMVKLAD